MDISSEESSRIVVVVWHALLCIGMLSFGKCRLSPEQRAEGKLYVIVLHRRIAVHCTVSCPIPTPRMTRRLTPVLLALY